MPFSPLRSMPATLVAFMMMCATPASSSTGPDLSPYPCTDDDPDRGGGLPHCECDAYHNGAFQCMSRMCSKPWEGMNVCYPTRVGHPGTVLEGRYFNNYCDDGQDMCSPWTPPASSFPVVVVDRRDRGDIFINGPNAIPVRALAARGCALPNGVEDQDPEDFNFIDSDGGCASCDGVPFLGFKVFDAICQSDSPDLNNYVSNSYAVTSDFGPSSTILDWCVCLWCPPEPPSGFSGFVWANVGKDYNYGDDDDDDFDSEDFCTGP